MTKKNRIKNLKTDQEVDGEDSDEIPNSKILR